MPENVLDLEVELKHGIYKPFLEPGSLLRFHPKVESSVVSQPEDPHVLFLQNATHRLDVHSCQIVLVEALSIEETVEETLAIAEIRHCDNEPTARGDQGSVFSNDFLVIKKMLNKTDGYDNVVTPLWIPRLEIGFMKLVVEYAV